MDFLLGGLVKGLLHWTLESRRWWSWLALVAIAGIPIALAIHFGDYAWYRANWPEGLALVAIFSVPLALKAGLSLYRRWVALASSGKTLAREFRLRRLQP
jgi:hypothetical protein